jgi:hypothetical protein
MGIIDGCDATCECIFRNPAASHAVNGSCIVCRGIRVDLRSSAALFSR